MKKIIFITLISISFLGFSQQSRTEKIKINKLRVEKINNIQDLIPSFPSNCTINEYQFIVDNGSKARVINVKNNSFSADLKEIVKNLKSNEQFFIENIKSDCQSDYKKNLVFVIQ
jgi:hypothetical protein